jgi:hypothetical protein
VFSIAPSLLTLHVFNLSGLLAVVIGGLLYIFIYVTLTPVAGIVSKSELKTAFEVLSKIKPIAPLAKLLILYLQRILNLKTIKKNLQSLFNKKALIKKIVRL